RLQRLVQAARLRHVRPIGQNRNHTNIARKCGRNFDRYEIIWIIKPALTHLVSDIQPVGTDNSYEKFARGNLIVEVSYEVNSRRNMVDIHEEIFSPETLGKPIVQPPSHAHRFVSAVINKNHLYQSALFQNIIAR